MSPASSFGLEPLLAAQLLETMADAFISVDPHWRLTYLNAHAERLLGGSRSELLGTLLWDRLPVSAGSAVHEQLHRVMATGATTTFEDHLPAPVDVRFEVRAWVTPDGLSATLVDVSGRYRDRLVLEAALAQTQAAHDRVELLADMTRALVSTLDADEAMARLLHLLVPRFADWSSVTLVDELGRLRQSVARHRDPRLSRDVDRFAELHIEVATDQSRSRQVARTGRAMLSNDVTPESLRVGWRGEELTEVLHRIGIGRVMVVPLTSREKVLGVIILAGRPGRSPFTETDLATATEIGRRAGLAIDNAQLYGRQRTAAETLQRHLLPALPRVPGLQITARYLPAAQEAQVGGDFYWGAVQPGGQTLVAIGDVSGHDLAATSWQAQLAPLLRGFAFESEHGPASVLSRVDHAMGGLLIDTMATVLLAGVGAATAANGRRSLRWSSAGHLPPVLIRGDGVAELLHTPAELLLGLDPTAVRTDHERDLLPGDTLLLFTDGLVERRGSDIDVDLDRLRREVSALGGLDLEDLADAVLATMVHDSSAPDDVALLAVRVTDDLTLPTAQP